MIKVVHVIPSLGIGGAEKLALDICSNLDKKKFKVYLVCLYDSDTFEFKNLKNYNIEIFFMHKKNGFDLKVIYRLIKLFFKIKPDVVNTHTYVDTYTIIPTILCNIKKRFHTVHSIASKELNNKLKKLMYLEYHIFGFVPIGISPIITESIKNEYNLENVITIHNCIDTSKFVKTEKKFNKNKIMFVNVARLSDVKNHELMIDVFYNVIKGNKNIYLKIIGDGPLKEKLETKIKNNNLQKNIKLLGSSDDVSKELNTSDCFILTSKFEGLPLSILEAMSCGLPIISTNVGGVSDIVVDGWNGYLADNNELSIENCIYKLLSSEKKMKNMGKNSLKVSKKYDVKIMAKEYGELYERRINNKK